MPRQRNDSGQRIRNGSGARFNAAECCCGNVVVPCCLDLMPCAFVENSATRTLTVTVVGAVATESQLVGDCEPVNPPGCGTYCSAWNTTFSLPIIWSAPTSLTDCEWVTRMAGLVGCPLTIGGAGDPLDNTSCCAESIVLDAFSTGECSTEGYPDATYQMDDLLAFVKVEIMPPESFSVDWGDYLAATPAGHQPIHARRWEFLLLRGHMRALPDGYYAPMFNQDGLVIVQYEFFAPGEAYTPVGVQEECHTLQPPLFQLDERTISHAQYDSVTLQHPYLSDIDYDDDGVTLYSNCSIHDVQELPLCQIDYGTILPGASVTVSLV